MSLPCSAALSRLWPLGADGDFSLENLKDYRGIYIIMSMFCPVLLTLSSLLRLSGRLDLSARVDALPSRLMVEPLDEAAVLIRADIDALKIALQAAVDEREATRRH